MLADDQLDIGKAFFRSTTVEGNLVNGQAFETGAASGAPIISACPWWFECKVVQTVEVGDHYVVIGEVIGAGVREGAEARTPLLLRSTGMNYGG